MTTKVDGYDPMREREVADVPIPKPTVACRAVHEDKGRGATPGLVVGKRHAVADQTRHAVSLKELRRCDGRHPRKREPGMATFGDQPRCGVRRSWGSGVLGVLV